MKNVHEYDGKLLIPELNKFDDNYKITQIKELLPKLTKINAVKMLQKIGQAIIIKSDENIDQENNVDASDILANILSKNYINIINLLDEQLDDMFLLGQCPQGRTTRLLQILNLMIDK